MKLTAPCVFGSLLAFLSVSWIKADEQVVLKGQGFGPCIATLRPERACSPGQHDASCPYLLHLPPLTVNLPPQFQELDRIMQDLQRLKESVDELREMCANCTVSQTGGECGRQSGEHEKITGGKGTREDEENWVRVIFEEKDGDIREECVKEKKTEKTYEDNTDDWLIRKGMEDKKSEADKISDKKKRKEKETIKEDTRIYDANPSEEEKYTQKYTKTKETDRINVSVNQEYWEETFGDGVRVNKNNEKPEQTELTENERTIKEMGLDEKSRTIGKEIKTERGNRVEDGELSSSKTTERADFASISPTPQVKMRTASRADSMDSRKLRTFTSSIPLPLFPSFTLSSITDVSQSTAAGHGPTQSTAGVPRLRSFDADLTTDTSTTTTVGGPGLETILNSASTGKLEGELQGTFSTSTTTPTIIPRKLYMTTSPRAEDDNNWKPKSPDKRPQPGRELHPGKKYPLGTNPEAKINLKKPPNKPDKAKFPVKKSQPHQKEKPALQKPKANKPKTNKDSAQTKNVKPVQKRFPDISKPDKNQRNSSLDTHNQGQPPDKNKTSSQSLTFPSKSPPADLKPTTNRPQLVNTTLSEKFYSNDSTFKTEQHENNPIKSTIKSYEDPLPGSNSNSESKYEENDNLTPNQDIESSLKRPLDNLNQKPKQELESDSTEKTTPRPDEKPNSEIIEKFNKNIFFTQHPAPNQITAWPTQRPAVSRNISKSNQTAKLGQAPKQNPKLKKPGTGLNTKPNKSPKPGQAPKTNPKLKPPRPGQKPHPGFTPIQDKIHKAQTNKTSKFKPPLRFRPPTRPTLEPPAETIQKQDPAVQPKPKLKIESGATLTQSSWTLTTIQTTSTTLQPTFGFVKENVEAAHSPSDNSPTVSFKKTTTEQPNNQMSSTEMSNGNLLPEPNSNPYTTSEEKKSQLAPSTAIWEIRPTQKTSTVHQNPKMIKEVESATGPTSTPKPLEGLKEVSGDNLHEPKSKEESEPKLTPTLVQTTVWPPQRPTVRVNISKTNQTAKLGQAPKQKPKFQKPGTGLNTKTLIKSKPGQAPKSNPKLKPPRPGQKPPPGFTPFRDKFFKAQSNKTSPLRPPYRFRPPTKPTLEPPAETNKSLNPAVQPQPKQMNKTGTDPTQISWTYSVPFPNTNTNTSPRSGLVKQISDMTQSSRDSESSVSIRSTIIEGTRHPITLVKNLVSEPNSSPDSTSEDNISELVNTTPYWENTFSQMISIVTTKTELESTTVLKATTKPLGEGMDKSDDNTTVTPKSEKQLQAKWTTTPVQTTPWPTQMPTFSSNVSKKNQTAKLGQAPKQNPKFKKPGTGLNIKTFSKSKPGQAPKSNPKLKPPRPGQKPHPGFTPILDKIRKAQTNRTSNFKPPLRFRPPTRPTLEPPAETIQKPDPAVQPGKVLKIESGATPTQSSWTLTTIQTTSTTMQPTFGFVKEIVEAAHSPSDNNPNVNFKKTTTEQPKNQMSSTEVSNNNLLPEPNSNPYTTSEEQRSQLVTSTALWDIKPTQKTSTVHQNPKTSKDWEFGASPTPTPKPLKGSREVSGDNLSHEPKPKEESEPKPTPTPVQTTAWPTQRPAVSRNISKSNQTAKLGQAPKQNPKLKKPGTGLNTKPSKHPKPGQPPKTISKLKPPRPWQKPHSGSKPVLDKIHKAQTNKTSKFKPPLRFRPPTRPTLEPPAETIQKQDPAVQPKPKLKIESGATPTQSSWTLTTIQTTSTTLQPTFGFVKENVEAAHSPSDNSPTVSFKKTTTEQPNNQMSSTEMSNGNLLPEPNSNPYTTSEEKKSQLAPSTAIWEIRPTQKTSTVHQNPKMIKEVESATGPTSTPKPLEGLKEVSGDNLHEPKSKEESEPKLTPTLVQTTVWPPQRPTVRVNISKTNQTAKLGQAPKQKPKFQKPGTGLNTKTLIKSKPGQAPKSNPKLKPPRPGQKPPPGFTPFRDKFFKAQSNKTSHLRPPYRFRPPTKPMLEPPEPPAETNKSLNPAVQPQPKQMDKKVTDPTPISWTSSIPFHNTPPSSGPVKQISEFTQSPWDSKNNLKNENVPSSPSNSIIISDMKPQKSSQPPVMPMTTKPNKVDSEIPENIISNTIPGSTLPSRLPKYDSTSKMPHNVEKSPPAITVPSPSSKTTSTIHPDFRSATPTTPGLDPQTSADSAQELRVKKNQVAAFPNNNQSPNRSQAEEHPKQHPKGTDGDETNKISTETPTTARRDCSDLLLLGEKQSGVYTVTPDPRSRSFPVFCDMEQEGGGWTVLQRRLDGSVSFNRTWADYRSGFGVLDGGEFWLGNNMIHLLTRDRNMVLRVELEDFNGVKEHAQYEYFKVASEKLLYKLMVGSYSGTAGDALRFSRMYNHNNRAFTTPDRDNDRYPSGNCGAYYGSGWWFDACMAVNLNGKYYVGPYKGVRNGIFWGTWHNISREYYPNNERHSFKTVRMMTRPAHFKP